MDAPRLLAENGDDTRIVYHGLGVGAATVLLATGETLPTQVRAVVAEGAYALLDDWFSLLADEQIRYPALPSLTIASMWNKGEQDFFYGDVSVTRQATKSRVPTMFIHGLKDELVEVRMMYELYQAKIGLKQLYPVRNAGHDETYTLDPNNYEKRLRLFLRPYLRDM
ncbi:alpha/beta hydrolase [Exiguobacterium sp. SL14]|nr:alpha/beta hydrolase [Exiguobacterium sp. SL14]MCY1691152.1 alpha/beta hydrolase [Exiguobacterium sp. SL14]